MAKLLKKLLFWLFIILVVIAIGYLGVMAYTDANCTRGINYITSKYEIKSNDIRCKKFQEYVYEDIKAVVDAAKGVLVKVIIECCYLTDEEKVEACKCCVRAGADFVKTSTGFGTGGATPADVKLMKETVGDACKVKAAGGVRNKEQFEEMIALGADRIGCSCGTKIMEEYENE